MSKAIRSIAARWQKSEGERGGKSAFVVVGDGEAEARGAQCVVRSPWWAVGRS